MNKLYIAVILYNILVGIGTHFLTEDIKFSIFIVVFSLPLSLIWVSNHLFLTENRNLLKILRQWLRI